MKRGNIIVKKLEENDHKGNSAANVKDINAILLATMLSDRGPTSTDHCNKETEAQAHTSITSPSSISPQTPSMLSDNKSSNIANKDSASPLLPPYSPLTPLMIKKRKMYEKVDKCNINAEASPSPPPYSPLTPLMIRRRKQYGKVDKDSIDAEVSPSPPPYSPLTPLMTKNRKGYGRNDRLRPASPIPQMSPETQKLYDTLCEPARNNMTEDDIFEDSDDSVRDPDYSVRHSDQEDDSESQIENSEQEDEEEEGEEGEEEGEEEEDSESQIENSEQEDEEDEEEEGEEGEEEGEEEEDSKSHIENSEQEEEDSESQIEIDEQKEDGSKSEIKNSELEEEDSESQIENSEEEKDDESRIKITSNRLDQLLFSTPKEKGRRSLSTQENNNTIHLQDKRHEKDTTTVGPETDASKTDKKQENDNKSTLHKEKDSDSMFTIHKKQDTDATRTKIKEKGPDTTSLIEKEQEMYCKSSIDKEKELYISSMKDKKQDNSTKNKIKSLTNIILQKINVQNISNAFTIYKEQDIDNMHMKFQEQENGTNSTKHKEQETDTKSITDAEEDSISISLIDRELEIDTTSIKYTERKTDTTSVTDAEDDNISSFLIDQEQDIDSTSKTTIDKSQESKSTPTIDERQETDSIPIMREDQEENIPSTANEELETEITIERPRKGRKRKYPEHTQNDRKKRKYLNLPFQTKNKRVLPKVFEDYACQCKSECFLKVSRETRKTEFEKYISLRSYESRLLYIVNSVKETKKKRAYTCQNTKTGKHKPRAYCRTYSIGNINVCKDMFLRTFQITNQKITVCLKKQRTADTNYFQDGRGKAAGGWNKTPTEDIEFACRVISSLPTYESHYRRAQNGGALYLRPGLTFQKIYDLYVEKHTKEYENKKCISIGVFKKIFMTKFNLKLKALRKDTCNKCDCIAAKLLRSDLESSVKESLLIEKETHLKSAETLREQMNKDIDKAKTDSTFECITFDMEKTLPLPRIPTNVMFYKRQLWFYNCGIHVASTNKGYCFVWLEGEAGRGAQEVGSCLSKYIKTNLKPNTKHLTLWSDCCGGQNRNIKVVLLLKVILADHPTLETITLKFLESGHSFLPNDTDFGKIESHLKHFERLYTAQDYISVIKSCTKKNPLEVVRMQKEDFLSTKFLEKNIVNRKTFCDKKKVNWLNTKEILLKKEKVNSIFMRQSGEEEFGELNVEKKLKGRTFSVTKEQLVPLWPNGKEIAQAKLDDLKSIFHLIPDDCLQFYKNLTGSTSVIDDIDGFGVPDFDLDQCLSENNDLQPID